MKLLEKLKSKKTIGYISIWVLGLVIGIGASPLCSDSSHDGVESKISTLETSVSDLEASISKKDKEIETLNAKVESATPWFEMEAEEQRKIEEENARVEAEKQAEAAKKAEEERIAKENAEKNKYETGITYNQVARNPDDYLLKLGKFKGKVVQVMEGDTHNNLRVAVGGNYDNMLLVEYDPSILSQRILEDDQVTIYGTNMGIYSYTSTMGAKISIPSMLADKIDIN